MRKGSKKEGVAELLLHLRSVSILAMVEIGLIDLGI